MLYNKDLNTINKKASTKNSKQQKKTTKNLHKKPNKNLQTKRETSIKKNPYAQTILLECLLHWNVYSIGMFSPLDRKKIVSHNDNVKAMKWTEKA